MTKRTWFRVHSFTGVITGLLLFVICWGGTFAVISHEIDWLVTPEVRSQHSLPADQAFDWQQIHDAVEAAYPEADISWLERPLYARSTAQAVVDFPDQSSVRVYVDPVSYEVLGHYSYVNVQRFFRSFHMNLFLPNRVGSYIVMAFSITLLISAIAALYFYSRWWTRFFRFKQRAFWSELHKTAGLWSLWFILVIALTSNWYLFELMRGHLGDGKVTFAGSGNYALHQIPAATSDPETPLLSIKELVATAQAFRPDLEIHTIAFDWGADGNRTIYIDGQSEHLLVRDRANQLTLDSRSGAVLYNQNAADYPLYWRWSDTADPLHFGDFGGLTSKLIWFVFGLILSAIILIGTWLHAKRLVREQHGRRRNRWPGTAAAMIASLLVLIASVPYGYGSFLQYYGVSVHGVQQFPALAPGVFWTIMLWIVITLAIIGLWLYWLFHFERHTNLAQETKKPSTA